MEEHHHVNWEIMDVPANADVVIRENISFGKSICAEIAKSGMRLIVLTAFDFQRKDIALVID
jgi:hypothetical protein